MIVEAEKTLYRMRDNLTAEIVAAGDFSLDPGDQAILRPLAARVAGLAARPIEAEKRALWYAHNALQPTRPLIHCDPENSWHEIFPPSALECRSVVGRKWELNLRKEIFWAEAGDDYVIEPAFNVPHVHRRSSWGLHETRIGGGEGGAYRWDPPVKGEADIEWLRVQTIDVDFAATQRLFEQAGETFGDLLDVRIRSRWWWISLGLTSALAELRGLEQMMLDMCDNPALIHRLMAFLRDGTLAQLDRLEADGLLSLNNDGTYIGSGGFGWTHDLPQPGFSGRVRPIDMWGFSESQETVGISPSMFAEFVLPYQLPILERFGLNAYGCCEPLDKRWHIVRQIPRLRRVSVSPWADAVRMAEWLGGDYILSLKPSPTELAMSSFDEGYCRESLRRMFRALRDCRVEVIMKDTHTIRNQAERVVRWIRIAREEAERV